MKSVIKNILDSFHNKEGGWSARKLTAFAFMCMAAYCVKYHVNDSNAVHALMVIGCIILLCLGIVTAENIIKFISAKNDTPGAQQQTG